MLFLGYQSSGKNYPTVNNYSERVKAEEQKLRQCERDLEQIFGTLLSGEVDGSTLSSSDQLTQYVECSFNLNGSDLQKSAQQQDELSQSSKSSVRKLTALSKLRRSLVRQKASTQSHTNQPINAIIQDADNSVLQNGQSSFLKLESQQQQQQEYTQQQVQTHAADVSVVESHVTLSQSIERLSTIAGDINVNTAEEFSMQSDITVLDTRDNQQFQHDKKSVEHGSIQQEVVGIELESDQNAAIILDQDNPSIAAIDQESKVLDAVLSDNNLVKENIPSAQVSSQNELESNINHENLQIQTGERTDASGQQMVFDLKTQRWIGNEDELDIFDQMDEEDDRIVDIMDSGTLFQGTHQNDTSSAKQETRKLSEVLLKDIQLGSLEDLEIDDVEQDNHDNNTSKPVVLKIGLGNELDDLDIITDSSDNVNDIDDDDDMAVTRQSMHSDSNSQQQQSRTAKDSDTQTLRSIKSLAPSIQSNSLEPDLSYFEVPARLEEWETQHNEWAQSLKGENFSFEDAFEASISQTRKPN
ncbi:hypothetical protein MP228_000818 [Amoeboaphelidium protococcarum]|nr:hypothetical protein MP228_000818 [Amoeboaphelidium protococcarum]